MTNTAPYVHVPHYPDYEQVRAFLRVVVGYSRKLVLSMRNNIYAHRGTPQENQDWSEPDIWIPELLTGEEQKLALRLWKELNGTINPRHLSGIWLLCVPEGYGLVIPDASDRLQITERGEDFLNRPFGETVKQLDYSEGLLYVLGLVAEKGPGKRADFLTQYGNFLAQYSDVRSLSVVKSNWYARMQNMVSRGLIERSGMNYQISNQGLEYLDNVQMVIELSPVEAAAPEPLRDIRNLSFG